MKHKIFLRDVADEAVVAAIRAAGGKTSAEIRVVVSHHKTKDAIASARQKFSRLGLGRSAAGNGVLIYVSPVSKRFAVVGGEGVHRHCGDEFWRAMAGEMEGYFRRGEWTEGLVHGITKAGELLGRQFPA